MQKIKNNSILFFSLILAMAVFFSLTSYSAAKSTKAIGQGNKNNTSTSTSTPGQEKNHFGQINAAEHRSAVANFVQALLKTASSTEGGIGKQVRIIAREQNHVNTTTAETIEKIQTRNKIKTFLIGSDYKNLGALRSEIVQTRNRIEQLNRVMGKKASTTEMQTELQTMEQEQTKIENFVKAQEGKFSLFGWFVKLFKK